MEEEDERNVDILQDKMSRDGSLVFFNYQQGEATDKVDR